MARVLLINDQPVFRFGLNAILGEEAGFHVVGEGETGQDALRLCASVPADIVMVDIGLRPMSGIDVCTELRRRQAMVRVIVWTAFSDDYLTREAVQAGASGVLPKHVSPSTVRDAIRAVHTGRPFIASSCRSNEGVTDGAQRPFRLTPQEVRVLQLLPRGLTNREIGDQLGVTDQTIKSHLSSAMRKLQVATRVEATTAVLEGCLR